MKPIGEMTRRELAAFIGAVAITYLLETMRVFAEYRLVIYGLLMFIVILYMPQGVAGMLGSLWHRVAAGKKGV